MAFVLLALLLVPDSGCVQAAEAVALRLLAQQNADGSWPSAPILRIPPPLTADPGRLSKWPSGTGTGVIIADQRRCFTTAAVLSALAACQGCTRLSESPDWLSDAVRRKKMLRNCPRVSTCNLAAEMP